MLNVSQFQTFHFDQNQIMNYKNQVQQNDTLHIISVYQVILSRIQIKYPFNTYISKHQQLIGQFNVEPIDLIYL